MRYLFLIAVLIILVFSSCDRIGRHIKDVKAKVTTKAGNFMAYWWDAFFELPDRSLKRKVNAEEFVGTWQLTPDSKARMDAFQKKYPDWDGIGFPALTFSLLDSSQVKAEFHSKYVGYHFRNYIFSPDEERGIVRMTGQWHLEKADPIGRGKGKEYRLMLQLESSKNTSLFLDLSIAEENGRLILWDYIGDPDNVIYQDFTLK